MNLILIGGYMYSGTTILYDIVTSHPDVLKTYKETKIFEFNAFLQKQYDQSSSRIDYLNGLGRLSTTDVFEKLDLTGNLIPDYFKLLERIALKNGYSSIAEASPNSYLFGSLFEDIGFDIKLLLITRDPRDIMASIKTRNNSLKRELFKSRWGYLLRKTHQAYSPMLHGLSIKATFRKIDKIVQSQSIPSIKLDYFELINDYESITKKISSFINLGSVDFPRAEELKVLNTAYSDKDKAKGLVYMSKYEKTLNRNEIRLTQFMQ